MTKTAKETRRPDRASSPTPTLSFGQRLALTRKQQGLTQSALGERLSTSGDIIGKYEREEMRPSVDVAARLADALSVSLDYLAGRADEVGHEDPETVRRLREIGRLREEERDRIYLVIDALLRDFQAQTIYKGSRK